MVKVLRFLLLGCAAGLAGCGGPTSLSGTVTCNGEPLADAVIVLTPQGMAAELVVGRTGPDGRFVITPSAGRSIAPGAYKVTVSKRVQTPKQRAATLPPEETIPEKYSDLSKTVLSVTVPGSADLELQLTR